MPPITWPVWSGSPPGVTDFFSPRPETGHGLDAGRPRSCRGQAATSRHVTSWSVRADTARPISRPPSCASPARSGRSDLQVWVNGSSPSAAVMGYARAAADIGLTDRSVVPDVAAARFLEWLSRTDRRWVIVLDNVTDAGGLRGLWPGGVVGQVRRHLPSVRGPFRDRRRSARICRIGEFSPREALGYLTARLYEDSGKRAEAVDLAADLGYMPLALALATTTIAGTALDCRQYRIRFAGRRQELLGRSVDGSVSSAEVAWSLALDRADQYPPAGLARPLLALAGLLDPAGLPVQVAMSRATCGYLSRHGRGTPADQQEVMAALGSLAQCGLVTIDQSSGPGLVAVHPVIQDTVRRLVPASVLDDAARSAADAIAEVWPEPAATPTTSRRCAGLVASLPRPGGNVTGIADDAAMLSTKRLSLLKALLPQLRRVAMLWNKDDLGMSQRYDASAKAAREIGVVVQPLGVREPDDFNEAFATMTREMPDAILMVSDALTMLNRKRVIDFAAEHRRAGDF